MKTKKMILSIILIFCIGIIGVASIVFVCASVTGGDAVVNYAKSSSDGDKIKESYPYGSIFSVPKKTIDIGGKSVVASHTMIKPDGSATTANTIVLDVMGKYSLSYTAYSGGRAYHLEECFFVDYPYVSCGEESVITWGAHKYSAIDDADYSLDPSLAYAKGRETEGMLVRLAKGETLEFNKLIDISDLKNSDTLIDGYITPDLRGSTDFTNLTIIFTDSIDPTVYMKINFNAYSEGGSSFVRACGNGQPYTGEYQYGTKPVHQNNAFGTSSEVSFTALRVTDWAGSFAQGVDAVNATFAIKYDSANKILKHRDFQVVDFDEPAYFSNLWSGFKSNKVRLSIVADGLMGNSANFCISAVYGYTEEELKGAIGSTFRDTQSPQITLNYDQTALPSAVLGMSYAILPATAFDDYSGSLDVTTRVWHNYISANKTRVNVENGRFNTNNVGVYAIEYSATDSFGNEGVKVVYINCVPNIDEISFDVENIPTTIAVGEKFELPNVENISGGSGEKIVEIYSLFKGQESKLTKWFNPQNVGEYKIVYKVYDFVGACKEAEFNIGVTANDKPVIISLPQVLNYYVEDSTYVVPIAVAKDYTTGASFNCKVEITDGNGTNTYSAGSSFVPKMGDGNITFAFKCNDILLDSIVAKTVKVFDKTTIEYQGNILEKSDLKMQNFFYAQNTEFETNVSEMKAITTSSNSDWTFVTAQLSQTLSVELKKFNFYSEDKITLTITDAFNSDIYTYLTLTKTSNGTHIEVKGGNETDIPLKMEGENKFSISYTDGAFVISGVAIETNNFNGFESDYVYLSATVNAHEGASYVVSSLNGITFTNASSDRMGPTIYILGDYGGAYSIGDTYTICEAKSADVLFPGMEAFTLNVIAPNGEYAKDVNGEVLSNVNPEKGRQIALEIYGDYRVSYEAMDGQGNKSAITYLITVVDRIAPEITIEEYEETLTVGENFILPKFTVEDNVCTESDIVIIRYVINANGKRVYLSDSDGAYNLKYAGVYRFHIMAIDASGNITDKTITITAKN